MSDEDSLNLIVEDAAPTALPTVQPTTNTFRLFGAKTRHIKLETAQPVIQVKKPENQFDEESLRKQCLLVAVNADWVIQQSHQKTIEKRSELICEITGLPGSYFVKDGWYATLNEEKAIELGYKRV